MVSTPTERTGFVRALSRLDATALVVGSMIGSGIFIVSADIVRQVQSPGLLLLVWGLSGIITVLGALTYIELAGMFPRAGGQYVYLREGVSALVAYLYGWTFFLVIQTGTIAAVAVAFARFTAVWWPALSPEVWIGVRVELPSGPIEVGLSWQRLFAVASILVLTSINVSGVKTAALIQTSLTAIKIASLAALIVLGVIIGRNADAMAANFGAGFWPAGGIPVYFWPAIGAAMVGSLFAMDAWNNVGFAAGEMRNPRRDLGFSMQNGVLCVVLLYLLANVAYLLVLPAGSIADAPEDRVGTAALQAMFGEPGLYLMALAIMISTFGCNNGMILAGARVYYTMAEDRASVLCLSGTYSQLLDYVIIAALLFYLLTAIGLFLLRRRRPEAERPNLSPGYPWLPAAYIALTALVVAILLVQKPQYTWPGLMIVALGVPVYFAWRRCERTH
ncbi:MAG: amino acid permease [Beggiatoa sp.]|nr:amino acid permease [Beggiatoa sp.]